MSARDQSETVPWSQEAEQSVLGALLHDNSAFDRTGNLSEREFYSAQHRAIYAAIAGLVLTTKPADVVTVYERLQTGGKAEECGGIAYLGALVQALPSASNVLRYAEIVREKASLRALIAATDQAASLARSTSNPAEAVDTITSILGALQRQHVAGLPRSICELTVERIDHYNFLHENGVGSGWSTHIPFLDHRLGGGLRAGHLYVLASRPGVGKSSVAQSIGLHLAADGLPTLLLSMEMTAQENTDRAISNLGRVSYSAIVTGKFGVDDWGRVSEGLEKLGQMPFFIDDQPALTLRDIRLKAKSIKDLQVLIVDYLQLCASTRRDGNRNGEIEEISRGLKALSKELGIAIVALSQLNREVEKRVNKRPTLADLRDSGAIEQDADVVMFLWPVRDLEAEGRRIVGLSIEKNRQGRLGEVGLDFYGDLQRWGESTADIRPPARSRGEDL